MIIIIKTLFPAIDDICAVVIVCRIRWKIIRTVSVLQCVPQVCPIICTLYQAVLASEPAALGLELRSDSVFGV